MVLYTFIMNFRGGTYISQVAGESVRTAMNAWPHQLPIDQIEHMGPASIAEIADAIKDEEPVAIKGMKNVWFFLLQIRMGSIHCNVVQTLY